MKVQLLGRSARPSCLNHYFAHPTVICQHIYGSAGTVGSGETSPALAVQISHLHAMHDISGLNAIEERFGGLYRRGQNWMVHPHGVRLEVAALCSGALCTVLANRSALTFPTDEVHHLEDQG